MAYTQGRVPKIEKKKKTTKKYVSVCETGRNHLDIRVILYKIKSI
jgi:hypothetical protein